jgi:hypothetical protein
MSILPPNFLICPIILSDPEIVSEATAKLPYFDSHLTIRGDNLSGVLDFLE